MNYLFDKQLWIEHMRVHNDDSYKPEGITSGVELPVPKTYTGCNHVWQQYQGFTDQFEFCVKCEEKR